MKSLQNSTRFLATHTKELSLKFKCKPWRILKKDLRPQCPTVTHVTARKEASGLQCWSLTEREPLGVTVTWPRP